MGAVIGVFLIGLITRFRELIHGGNAAKRAMRPLIDGLGAIRPKFVAQNGDAGYCLDNTTPWYEIYLTVDLTPDPEETVRSAARDAGYRLETHQQDQLNPTWSHLAGERDGRTLTVTIARDDSVSVRGYGYDITYGTRISTPPGRAIVSLSLSLPPLEGVH
jgi:hypothetical protein